jgi:hypothetical protein
MRHSIIIFTLILTHWGYDTLACKCKEHNTIFTEFEQSDMVISGKVISIKPYSAKISPKYGDPFLWKLYEVTFQVENKFKNCNSKQITVYTGTGGGDCGFTFKVGKKYIVYSYNDTELLKNTSMFLTDYCSRTCLKTFNWKELSTLNTLTRMNE